MENNHRAHTRTAHAVGRGSASRVVCCLFPCLAVSALARAEVVHDAATSQRDVDQTPTSSVSQASTASVPQANAAPASTEAPQENLQEVVVTGTLLGKATATPSPVSTVSSDQLQAASVPNVADALAQLPQLTGTLSAGKGGNSPYSGSFLNLRNLGPVRTLVLLDGERFVPASQFGSGQGAVNIDALPQGLIKRVDIVTGGASAAYGSDAVAGVVNFVLDRNFEGFKGDFQGGATQWGDGENYRAELTAGGGFADGRGHVVTDVEYARDFGILGNETGTSVPRGWEGERPALVSSGGVLQLISNPRVGVMPQSGVIFGGPLNGTAFNPDGTTRPYNFGTGLSGVFASGGDGFDPAGISPISTPSERSSLYSRVNYDVTSSINVYLEALTSKQSTDTRIGAFYADFITSSGNGFNIGIANPYIPTDVRSAMVADGLTSINLRKTFLPIGQAGDSRTDRVVAGLSDQFNDNWSGKLYYEYGETDGSFTFTNDPNTIAWQQSIDAVAGPNGQVVCRSTLTNPNNGCVPYNPFGTTTFTAQQRAWLLPTDSFDNSNTEQMVDAIVNGSLFSLPAGTVDVAVGSSYRSETLDRSTDSLGLSLMTNPYTHAEGALAYEDQPAVHGSYDLWEAFAETKVPILAHLPFAQALDLDLADRYTHYSTSGGVNTWKAGLVYAPVDSVRLRTTVSRDIRAPNVTELFSPPTTGFGNVRDPEKNGATVLATPISSGNPDLRPEYGKTVTAGVVLRPTSNLHLSLDYYSIRITGEIGTLTGQQTVNFCAAGLATYCAAVNRDSAGNIVSILLPTLNLSNAWTNGLDLDVGGNWPVVTFGVSGAVNFEVFSNYIFHNETTPPGVATIDLAPQAGRFTTLAQLGYETGRWRVDMQEHYSSGGLFDATVARYPGDAAGHMFWTDLSLRYALGHLEMYGSILNLFNADPPPYPITNSTASGQNGFLFDLPGRRFELGVRFSL